MPVSFLVSGPAVTPARPLAMASCIVTLDWPYEIVTAMVEVVTPRDVTTFEYGMARILDEFGDAPPSLTEMAEELGLRDALFLEAILEELVDTENFGKKDPSLPADPSNLFVTPAGRAAIAKGRTVGLPARHQMRMQFDAITGHHVPKLLGKGSSDPAFPVVYPGRLADPVSDMGLDRARELARVQDEPFLDGRSIIRSVVVRPGMGGHTWVPMQVSLSIDHEGVLRARLDNATSDQEKWFNNRDLTPEFLTQLDAPLTQHLFDGSNANIPVVRMDEWLDRAERLIPPSDIIEDSLGLVDEAEDELVYSEVWQRVHEPSESLAMAENRGVRCSVRGDHSDPQVDEDGNVARADHHPTSDTKDTSLPIAIIADGTRGICIDRVPVRTPGGRTVTIEIASYVRSDRLSALRERLLTDRGKAEATASTEAISS